MTDSLFVLPDDCDFDAVSNASTQEYACSPMLKDRYTSQFTGILINAPKHVSWSKEMLSTNVSVSPSGQKKGGGRLMLSGLTHLKYKALGLKGRAGKHVLLVAVNQKTAVSYSGKMPKRNFKPRPLRRGSHNIPEVIISEAEQNSLLMSHFNFDLIHDLGLPITDATYHVYATLGEYKSNVLTIKTSVEE